ncbi:MAG: glycosidase [Puniceicoccaceae bacterium]
MIEIFERHPQNPIITPGKETWRQVAVFNPGVVLTGDNKFILYERAAGSLRPFHSSIGALISDDGVNFELAREEPILTGEMVGFPDASIEDARVTKIDDLYYLVFAMQPYSFDCWPNGIGVPEYYSSHYREWKLNKLSPMMTQSGIAVSSNGFDFTFHSFTTPRGIDDRDNVLFPGKFNGKFALLRRPQQFVGERYGTDKPGIWISFSEDLNFWEEPGSIAFPEQLWEEKKIGAATTPIETPEGWLCFYHGVDAYDVYRLGAMLLDINNPAKVIARTKNPIMQPTMYYEKYGLVIPNVIFPTDNVLKDDSIFMYYGCCDTSISLATCELDKLLAIF